MKKTLIAAVVGTYVLTGCAGSMTLDDGGRYDGYRTSVLALATAAQETERIRIMALARLAETSDDRTRDRVVAELSGRQGGQGPGIASALQAPAAPTHLGLEALRILGPGAIGLMGQGIGAWAQHQADQLSTQRHIANNELINSTVQTAIESNANLSGQAFGVAAGAQSVAASAISKIPTPAPVPSTTTTTVVVDVPTPRPKPDAPN